MTPYVRRPFTVEINFTSPVACGASQYVAIFTSSVLRCRRTFFRTTYLCALNTCIIRCTRTYFRTSLGLLSIYFRHRISFYSEIIGFRKLHFVAARHSAITVQLHVRMVLQKRFQLKSFVPN